MFLYEYRIRDEIGRIKSFAENIRNKYNTKTPNIDDLLIDAENLQVLYSNIKDMLPEDVIKRSSLLRHISWMIRLLTERKINSTDIDDICNYDIPDLEKSFHDWVKNNVYFDKELNEKTSDLVIRREFDSAIRRAFVILKSRMVNKFNCDDNLDGVAIVNQLFGRSSNITSIDENDRQALRDLLAGLYGVFRNKYAHHDTLAPWHEADAVLSMINYSLKRIDEL